MTDKAVVEIPAKNAGTVHRLYYAQGDIAKVHSALFSLEVEGGTDQSESHSTYQGTSAEKARSSEATTKQQTSTTVELSKFKEGEFEPPVAIPGKVLASPAVRRVARENNIDLNTVKGSGKKGRILKTDVINLDSNSNETSKEQAAHNTATPNASAKRDINTITPGDVRTEKVRGIQAAMAKQMSASVYTIPHFTVSDELVMDSLMALRKLLKPEFEAKNIKLSFMPFFVKAMSLAVINKPEAAIVALGKTQKLPRFDEEGNVSAQHIMAVNWSGDHRIIDGATMVRFNNLWMSYLTQPEKMLMHLR